VKHVCILELSSIKDALYSPSIFLQGLGQGIFEIFNTLQCFGLIVIKITTKPTKTTKTL
jgi:hypothetical protein